MCQQTERERNRQTARERSKLVAKDGNILIARHKSGLKAIKSTNTAAD